MVLPPRIFSVLTRRCHRFADLPARQPFAPPRHRPKPATRWWQNVLPIMNMLRPRQRQPLLLFKILIPSPGLVPFGARCKPISIKGLVFWGLLPTGHFVMCRIAPAALI